jgi:hypothetical protein
MSTAKFDLTTTYGVKGYLEGTAEFASCGPITKLSGCTANYAYRVALGKPYMGKNTVVIKHAEKYVKDMTTLPFDVSRQAGLSIKDSFILATKRICRSSKLRR